MVARVVVLLGLAAVSLITSGCRPMLTGNRGPLEASGAIEADEVRVAPELGGRVLTLTVDKGAAVSQGQVLAQLDTTFLQAQRDQARGAVAQAQGGAAAARAQLEKAQTGARPEEVSAVRSALAAAEAALKAAAAQKEGAEARRRSAEANLAAVNGQLKGARAGQTAATARIDLAQAGLSQAQEGATGEELGVAERTVEAARNVLWGAQAQRDSICGQVGRGARASDCDAARAAVQLAEEQVRIAELQRERLSKGARDQELAALRAGVDQAKAGLDVAGADADIAAARVRAAEATLAQAGAELGAADAALQMAGAQRDQAQAALALVLAGARREEIAILEAQVKQAEAALFAAEAALRGIETQIERMTLVAPVRGVVLTRTGHVGELATPGVPLYTLADLQSLTLTVYIPEPHLGEVALDQPVQVRVDAYPDSFGGRVSHIASRAEFTPKNVETREERVNMVFAVEITLENQAGRLRPGMPADVVFAP